MTEGSSLISSLVFADGLPTWALFLELLAAATVVIIAGGRFAILADRLADRLNLASGWVGLILLATVTSLPEVVAGGTATALGNTDLAMAAIFGSCSFNITLIVLLNALMGGGSVLKGVSRSHGLTSAFGLLLMGLALLGIVLTDKFCLRPNVARICEGVWAVVILITYLGCMRLTYQFEKKNGASEEKGTTRPYGAMGYAQIGFIALVLVAASWWLAQIGDVLSTHPIEMIGRPLGATFVGVAFLAIATSLPEITTSVTAVRLGNLDLALGNLFGSNMFNIVVIPILKIVSMSKGEPLLMKPGGFDSTQALIAGLLAILLTAIAVGGLTYKSEKRMLRRFGFDSILIALVYIGGMALLLTSAR